MSFSASVTIWTSPFQKKEDIVQERVIIDWGDGTKDVVKTINDDGSINNNLYTIPNSRSTINTPYRISHQYRNVGAGVTYGIKISGEFRDATNLPRTRSRSGNGEPKVHVQFRGNVSAIDYQPLEIDNMRQVMGIAFYKGTGYVSDTSLPATIVNPSKASSIISIATTFILYSGDGSDIPAGFFSTINPQEAHRVFENCKELTSIPAGLFDNMTDMRTAYDMFAGSPKLKTLPVEIFRYNTKLYDMRLFSPYNNGRVLSGLNTADYSRLLQELITYPRDYDSLRAGERFMLHGGTSKYDAAGETARNQLLELGWDITDGGRDVTAVTAEAAFTLNEIPNLTITNTSSGAQGSNSIFTTTMSKDARVVALATNKHDSTYGPSSDGNRGYIQAYSYDGTNYNTMGNKIPIGGASDKNGTFWSGFAGNTLPNIVLSDDGHRIAWSDSLLEASYAGEKTKGVMKVYDWDGSDWQEVFSYDAYNSDEAEGFGGGKRIYDETQNRLHGGFARSLDMSGDGTTIIINKDGKGLGTGSTAPFGVYVFTNFKNEPQTSKQWQVELLQPTGGNQIYALNSGYQTTKLSVNQDGTNVIFYNYFDVGFLFQRTKNDRVATTPKFQQAVTFPTFPNSMKPLFDVVNRSIDSDILSEVKKMQGTKARVFRPSVDDPFYLFAGTGVGVTKVQLSDDAKTLAVTCSVPFDHSSQAYNPNVFKPYYTPAVSSYEKTVGGRDVFRKHKIHARDKYGVNNFTFTQIYKTRDSFPASIEGRGIQVFDEPHPVFKVPFKLGNVTVRENDFYYMGSYNADAKLVFEPERRNIGIKESNLRYGIVDEMGRLNNGMTFMEYRDSIIPDKSTIGDYYNQQFAEMASDNGDIFIKKKEKNKYLNNIGATTSQLGHPLPPYGEKIQEKEINSTGAYTRFLSGDGNIAAFTLPAGSGQVLSFYGVDTAVPGTTPAPTTPAPTTTPAPGTNEFSRLGDYLTSSDFASNGATNHSFGNQGFGNQIAISDDGSTVFIVSDQVNRTNASPSSSSTIINALEWNSSNEAWESKGNTIELVTQAGKTANPSSESHIASNSDGTSFVVAIGSYAAARVYNWNGSAWTVATTGATLTDFDGADVLPAIGGSNDYVVTDVDMNAAGNLVIIGSATAGSSEPAGAAAVFKLSGGTWSKFGSDIEGVSILDVNEKLGEAVAIHGTYTDDNTNDIKIFVASPNHWKDTTVDDEVGKVEYYKYDTSTQAWSLKQTLYGEQNRFKFGYSMGLSEDGDYLIIADRIRVKIYEHDSNSDTYEVVEMPNKVGVGNALSAAYSSTSTGNRYGSSVAVSNSGSAIIGAPFADSQVGSVELWKCGNSSVLDMSEACSSGLEIKRRMLAVDTEFTPPSSFTFGPVRDASKQDRVTNDEFKLYETDSNGFKIGDVKGTISVTTSGGRTLGRHFGQRYGKQVAMSKNGNIIVVSAPFWRNMDTATGKNYINSFDSGAVDNLGNKGRVMIFSFNNSTPPVT